MANREEKSDRLASTVLWSDGSGASRKIDESLEPTAHDSKDKGCRCPNRMGRSEHPGPRARSQA